MVDGKRLIGIGDPHAVKKMSESEGVLETQSTVVAKWGNDTYKWELCRNKTTDVVSVSVPTGTLEDFYVFAEEGGGPNPVRVDLRRHAFEKISGMTDEELRAFLLREGVQFNANYIFKSPLSE